MTPIERLIHDFTVAFQQQHWYDLAAYEVAARAQIKAQAESNRRSLGQQFRYAANRLQGALK